MEILKYVFYILVFPGFLFSSALGMLFLGIVESLLARMQKRVSPHVLQYFYDLFDLIKKVKNISLSSEEKVLLTTLVIGLVSLTSAALFIPIFNFSAFTGEADMVVVLYLLMIPTAVLLTGKIFSASKDKGMNVSRQIIEIFLYEFPFIIILLVIGKKAGMYVNKEAIIFSLSKIIGYQAQNGSMITNWSIAPAMLGMLMIISFKTGNFTLTDSEKEIHEEEINGNRALQLIIYKINRSIKTYAVTSLFVTLFLSGAGTGIVIADILLQILLSIIIAVISISLFNYITGIFNLGQRVKYLRYYPAILALIGFILVFYGL